MVLYSNSSFIYCPECNSNHLALSSIECNHANCVCLDCGLITPFSCIHIFTQHKLTAHCANCKYSYSFDDSPNYLFCGCTDSEAYEQSIDKYFDFEADNKYLYCRCNHHVWGIPHGEIFVK